MEKHASPMPLATAISGDLVGLPGHEPTARVVHVFHARGEDHTKRNEVVLLVCERMDRQPNHYGQLLFTYQFSPHLPINRRWGSAQNLRVLAYEP